MILFDKPIEVISKFSPKGELSVMRFRYEDNNEERIVVKVDHCKEKDQDFPGQYVRVFDCKSYINGSYKRYQLRYYYYDIQWELYV